MPMSNQSTETQIALLIAGQENAHREMEELRGEVAALRLERDKALKWGVMSLGSAVLAMGYWIVNKIIGGHIQ
jgi:hypothetical protein